MKIMNTEKPFELTIRVVWWMQIIQILFALPFTIGSIFFLISIIQGATPLLLPFIVIAFLAYMGWANALSTIQITEKSVTVTVLYGRFRIYWDEIENIANNGPLIALTGNEKRVVLSLLYMNQNSKKMLEFFGEQLQKRNILFEQNVSEFPFTHQNARVRW